MVAKLRNRNLDLKSFKLIFELCKKQPWLENKQAQLYELIDSCSKPEEIELVSTLLREFTYVYRDTLIKNLENIVNYIVNDLSLDQHHTQIAAFTYDGSEADSGQLILQLMKPLFAKYGWDKPKTLNLCTQTPKHIKDRPWVILVDEFIGSGKTISTRIEYLTKEFDKRGVSDYIIVVCVATCMNHAKKIIEASRIPVYSPVILNKGISEYFSGEDLADAMNIMNSLETLLMPVVDNKPLPKLGYMQAEALYAMEDGNCPNSVFPIFWWPQDICGEERNRLLVRVEL